MTTLFNDRDARVNDRDARAAMISVVLPVFNEVAVLEKLAAAVLNALQPTVRQVEIVFVNDGSRDGSEQLLDQLAERDQRIRVLHFSRNFGHQPAVHAGLCHARGDAVLVMDSDMQDDPVSLPRFVDRWNEGADVVYAVREKRKESAFKRSLFFGFYRVLNAVSDTPLPNDAGNFCLMSRPVVDNLIRLGEVDRYFPGLRAWVGFRQVGLTVERLARHDDQPRVSIWGLIRLARTALFSFSAAPLALFYLLGGMSLLVCTFCGAFTLYHKLVTGQAIPGWASTVIIGSFFGALNALGIGVLGEYVVRIYDQVRGRPTFVVARESSRGAPANETPENDDTGLEDALCETVSELAGVWPRDSTTARTTGFLTKN